MSAALAGAMTISVSLAVLMLAITGALLSGARRATAAMALGDLAALSFAAVPLAFSHSFLPA